MPFGRRVGDKGSIRGRWRVKDDKVENQLMWTRDEGGYVPEKIRMVSIPERKLDCASSCGGFGVVDREGMGVMDLENPFSLDSETFDSVVKREFSVNPWEILDQEGRGDRNARHRRLGCRRELVRTF